MKCQAGIVLNISDFHDGKGRVQKNDIAISIYKVV